MKKKGQEEIIGFVIIVVIVAIIFLVYLGISIRQEAPATQRDSGDVLQFLNSIMEYTSECAIRSDNSFVRVGELVKECYSSSSCRNGESACNVLNKLVKETIESNWPIGVDRPVKGYIFNSTYNSGVNTRDITLILEGNCTREIIGAEYLSPAYPGNVRSELKICY